MGGTQKRMYNFANYIMKEIDCEFPYGSTLLDISQNAHRYSMYKIGPVLSVNVSNLATTTSLQNNSNVFIYFIFFSTVWEFLQLAYYCTKLLN